MKSLLLTIIILLLLRSGYDLNFIFAQESDEQTHQAREALRTGDYTEARKLFGKILKNPDKEDFEQAIGYIETYIALGEYQEGLEEVEKYLKESTDDPYLLNAKGKLFIKTGRYLQAIPLFKRAGSVKGDFFRNTLDLAEVLELTGRKSDARALYSEIYQQVQRNVFTTSNLITLGAIAASRLEDFHAANRAFNASYRIDPQNVNNLYVWASLFRDKFNNADAQRTFEDALEINPHWADLYTGYARSMESFLAMEELANKALNENPNHVEALNILAELHILDSRYDEAETVVTQALNINPSSATTLANLASIFHLREDERGFKEIEGRALTINPACGDFYVILMNNCGLRFRYQDAVHYGFMAVDYEPDNWSAHAVLGTNLLRIGRVDEAQQYLNVAYTRDQFNLFARNSLDLIDEYDHFDMLHSDHYDLKIHESESVVLGPLILKLAEEAYDSLSTRYPYSPAGKILLEAYNDHADFAVRISGLPNLDLIGVCFGDIVAFDTPKAYTEGEHNWARTLWHELAHVMTIGLSDHRVPRWLTEGLSVYEEKRARKEWTRKMDMEFFTALDNDRLLSLEEINSGFTRPQFPGQIMLSYYQSMKIVEFIAKEYGFEVIPELLTGFGERMTQEANFKNVLKASPSEVNRDFFKYLESSRKSFDDVITGNENLLENEENLWDKVEKFFVPEKKSPYFDNCMQGIELLKNMKFREAEEKLLKAIELYPDFVGTGNPYQGLAEIYRTLNEYEKLADILQRFLAVSEFGAAESREVASYHAEKGDFQKAAHYYTRSFLIEPYDLSAHLNLAELYKPQKMFDLEAEQRRIVVALDPVDKAKSL